MWMKDRSNKELNLIVFMEVSSLKLLCGRPQAVFRTVTTTLTLSC
jgi:hypothetical protein